MNCTICGAMIPDGQSNCPNCGAAASQPAGGYQQPTMGQPMGGYQQPTMGQPTGGYQQPTMGQPTGGYQQPTMGQPMGGYQQPTMGQPMGGYQQPNMGQPMGGYQQPNMGQPMGGGVNLGGFVNSMKSDVMKLVGFIGAILILLTPFFNWCSMKIKSSGESEKESANMIKLAGDYGNIGIFAFFAIILILVGAVLILWDLADFVPAIANLKAKISAVPYIELILVAVALLFVILALANGELNANLDVVKASIKMAKAWSVDVSGHANHGFGPIIGFLGIIAAALPRVLKILNINVGKK